MHHIRRFAVVGLLILFFVAIPVLAQGAFNPNANISWPPPIYVLRGDFEIRGSASLPNMTNYFIEFRPINEDVTIPSQSNWFPATVPSRRVVQDGVLGVWDTTAVEDGAYELRLTVNVRGAQPVFDIVSPLRVENETEFGGAGGGMKIVAVGVGSTCPPRPPLTRRRAQRFRSRGATSAQAMAQITRRLPR
jgi:hypothetical protein